MLALQELTSHISAKTICTLVIKRQHILVVWYTCMLYMHYLPQELQIYLGKPKYTCK